MFSYVYPGYRTNIPSWVPERLLERARAQIGRNEEGLEFTRGPLISRFSFAIDVREWGFISPRDELVHNARQLPEIKAIAEADVWDARAEDRADAGDEFPTCTCGRPSDGTFDTQSFRPQYFFDVFRELWGLRRDPLHVTLGILE